MFVTQPSSLILPDFLPSSRRTVTWRRSSHSPRVSCFRTFLFLHLTTTPLKMGLPLRFQSGWLFQWLDALFVSSTHLSPYVLTFRTCCVLTQTSTNPLLLSFLNPPLFIFDVTTRFTYHRTPPTSFVHTHSSSSRIIHTLETSNLLIFDTSSIMVSIRLTG